MRKGQDLIAQFPGLLIIHQKIPGRVVERHQHSEHEFFLPLQGEITLYFDSLVVSGGPGRMIYSPPDQEHSFSSNGSGEGERVIFLVTKKLWAQNSGSVFSPMVVPANSLIRELIFYLLLNPKSAGIRPLIDALIHTTQEHFNVFQGRRGSFESLDHISGKIQDPRVRTAIEKLEKILEQPSMAELANQSGLSLRNFNRLFLAEVGATPKQYATLLKIEEAKKLLKTTSWTVTDIALEAGYHSLSKFISAFQKHTGQLPSEFRRTE